MNRVPLIFDLEPESLAEVLGRHGMAGFRAKQVLEWVYKKGVIEPKEMTNLSVGDREVLREAVRFGDATVLRHQRATDGVQKLLVGWGVLERKQGREEEGEEDGEGKGGIGTIALPLIEDMTRQTECVMIPWEDRKTACISSQVGCPVGCGFCASGLGGLDANLSAGQIVEQVWRLNEMLRGEGTVGGAVKGAVKGVAEEGVRKAGGGGGVGGGGITNVVFMGMGEPMANFDAVVRAIRTLVAEWGLNLSARKITVSTVGLPAQIRRLAEVAIPVTLAVSLHAPNDAIRKRIIPWAEFVSIDQLVEAGRYYFDKTGREITLEYILLGGVNDQKEHAEELAKVARRLRSNVNLIRYNEVDGLEFARPEDGDVRRFQAVLKGSGVNTHIRASRGRDIAAACGQLRHEGAG